MKQGDISDCAHEYSKSNIIDLHTMQGRNQSTATAGWTASAFFTGSSPRSAAIRVVWSITRSRWLVKPMTGLLIWFRSTQRSFETFFRLNRNKESHPKNPPPSHRPSDLHLSKKRTFALHYGPTLVPKLFD